MKYCGMPDISIILKVGKTQESLYKIVNSFLTQSFENFELIIINDNQLFDNCRINWDPIDVRLKFLDVASFENSETWRLITDRINGKYVVFVDTSHLMMPHKLQTQLCFMEKHEKVDICGTWVMGENCKVVGSFPVWHNDIEIGMLFSNVVYSQSVMMRKAVFEVFLKLYQMKTEDNRALVDYEIWCHLIIKGYLFANIPEALLKVCASESVSSLTNQDMQDIDVGYIQCLYLDYLMNKIVEIDPGYFDILNEAVELQSCNKLSLSGCKVLVKEIYNIIREKEETALNKSKIKILFCIETLGGGGAEKLLIDILKRFDFDKYAVDLLVLFEGGVYFADIPEEVSWFSLASGKIEKRLYDVEVAFLEGWAVKYIAERNSTALKIAWIHIDLYNFHWTKSFYKSDRHEYEVYKKMNKIVFVTENIKRQFEKLFGGIPAELLVIHNFIDQSDILEKSEGYKVSKRKFTLCSIGRLTPMKGYLSLIRTVHRLVDEGLDFDLWIVGEGEQRMELEDLIQERSLTNTVFLQGFHKNPIPFLKEADIFVSSSSVEGFSLVIGEALCLGKPVVATKNAGSEEVLDGGKYGMLIEQGDDFLYEALKNIIQSEGLRFDLQTKAFERSGWFDVSNAMDKIYTVLQ